MVQAAPAPRTSRAAPVSRPWVVLTAVLGVVYGLWAAQIGRDSGPITGYNVLLGVVSGVLFGVCFLGLHLMSGPLTRELHAGAWAAFAGISFGFLYSLTGESVLRSSGMALGAAAFVFAVRFYRYYTQED